MFCSCFCNVLLLFQILQINVILCRDPSALAYAIKRSCENKAEVVSLDEKESGLRATLNLGHTFGHVSISTVYCITFCCKTVESVMKTFLRFPDVWIFMT